MTLAVAALELARHLAAVTDDIIPNPAPVQPPAGAGAVSTLLSWLKWGALACCVGAAVLAGGMIAVGNTSRRAELAERGKVTLICALLGAVVVAIGGTLVSSSFTLQ